MWDSRCPLSLLGPPSGDLGRAGPTDKLGAVSRRVSKARARGWSVVLAHSPSPTSAPLGDRVPPLHWGGLAMCPAVTKDTRAEAPVCPLCTEAFRVGSACLCALATTLSVMIPESQVAEPFPMAQGSVPAYTVIGPQFTTNPHFLLPLGKVGPTTARQEGSAAWMQDLCPEREPEATSQSPSLPLVLWSIGGPTGLGYQGSCQVPWHFSTHCFL